MHPRHFRSAVLGSLFLPGLVCVLPGPPLAAQEGTPASRKITDLKNKVESDNRAHPSVSLAAEEEALALLSRDPDPEAETWFLLSQIRDAIVLKELKKAAASVERSRVLVRRTGNQRDHFTLEVEAANLLLAQEHLAESKAAAEALLPALEAYRANSPRDQEMGRLLARAYRNLSTTLRNLGRLSEAIRILQKAQRTSEDINDRAGRARILDRMGYLYVYMRRFDEAVASHRAAIAEAESLGDVRLQAPFHLSLANAYGSMGDSDRQLAEMRTASELAGQVSDSATQLLISVNMADVYLGKKDYRKTLKFADEAMKLAVAAQDPGSIAVCQVNRGIALNRLGSSAEGLKAIQEGLAHFRASGAINDSAEITGNLAEEFAFAGDYRRAYETEVEFKNLADSLKASQDQKHIADASAAFESDKQQLQIQALQRDRRNQARLRLLWIALGALGFGIAGVLVLSRRRLESANKALADMSLRDPLTSLANRRYLTTRIAEDLAQVNRLQRLGKASNGKDRMMANIDVVFLMIDIDHFKAVNDEHGHVAGDNVLKQFAGILSQTMRDSDTVVRWGGEEFFVVAKHTSRADAHLVAERIRSRVEAFNFDLGNGGYLHKTCSIGYASYPFFRREPAKVAWEKVAEVADQCLYAAKSMGRNTWVGVHEAVDAPESLQEIMAGYPNVSGLVAKGVLMAESHQDQAITWAS
ncbi:tetratricopeptide repeat-containing diguanylate cyclase [Geothrix sp. 21YS21S-2]|uniref:tetratricopeptide repeat-containing diguanylate cyclase n=1 Tax=Geothrix sp. 21YS21S-2 TaxID=3068893 RepID=UPI0027BB0CA0|nr:tetratricopeptide repeat-containing diguanylate cyclase [Geothrix sp. 21YS21S-2]